MLNRAQVRPACPLSASRGRPQHHLDPRRLKLGQYLFQKHGGTVVFFGRFVSVLRTWAAFLAGVNRMDWWRFLAFNAAGGALWAKLYGVGSYALGEQIHLKGAQTPVHAAA